MFVSHLASITCREFAKKNSEGNRRKWKSFSDSAHQETLKWRQKLFGCREMSACVIDTKMTVYLYSYIYEVPWTFENHRLSVKDGMWDWCRYRRRYKSSWEASKGIKRSLAECLPPGTFLANLRLHYDFSFFPRHWRPITFHTRGIKLYSADHVKGASGKSWSESA